MMTDTRSTASTGKAFPAATELVHASPAISSPAPQLVGGTLLIPPFRVQYRAQSFIQWTELRIDLATLEADLYRILVVQNFWIEDPNPDLEQCLAGIFLARQRRDGDWETPENWPLECRSVALIGHLDLRCRGRPMLVATETP